MDPADSASRQLSIQAEVLERHEEMLKHVSKEQTALLQAMTELKGRRSVADFSVEFWILAEESGWEEKALRGAFLNSLNENIKRELATKELPKALSALINMCIDLDDHMREFGRRAGDGRRPAGGTGTSRDLPTLMWRSEEEEQHGDEEQPMQLGGAKLSSSRLGRKQRTGGASGEASWGAHTLRELLHGTHWEQGTSTIGKLHF
ncbi:uncharacterized protein LOC112435280 [Maylandia zebra]|uniref:uncharacterized protein LOC112435280 n=1 Tax=Maylandia zebra TaxID=106582 RepID=UPI00403C1ED9